MFSPRLINMLSIHYYYHYHFFCRVFLPLLMMMMVLRKPNEIFATGFIIIPQQDYYHHNTIHHHSTHNNNAATTLTLPALQMVAQSNINDNIEGHDHDHDHDHHHHHHPTDDNDDNDNINEIRMKQNKFKMFLEECIITSTKDPNHLPKLMANNIELIMSLHGIDGTDVIEELLQQYQEEDDDSSSSSRRQQHVRDVIEVVLEFAEELVDFSVDLDDHNKHLLGKIFNIMTNSKQTQLQREEQLDEFLSQQRHNFTPGFLRHLEGECTRIENAPKPTQDSLRLLEIIRVIQTRVLEELGRDIGQNNGEAAIVLGQLMGYETIDEMIGVLDAGLTVRGREFGIEMKDLTSEALEGFQRVPNVDPDLVERVTKIYHRLEDYLDESNQFM